MQQSEDAPYVASGFRFLPGDTLYFTFQISGFAIESSNHGQLRKISLAYEVTPEDASGVPLTPSGNGEIQVELNPEDKHWTPKRRVSFPIPSSVAAGDFHIHVLVKDLVAKSEATRDFPFRIGGLELHAAPSVTLEHFRFLRNEDDQEPLEVPAFSPGDSVYSRFEIAGFKTGVENAYHVSYGLIVLRPDGTTYLNEPKAAELADKTFYPAQYLPGNVAITTSASTARGEYILIITVHDLIANTTYQSKKAFSIE